VLLAGLLGERALGSSRAGAAVAAAAALATPLLLYGTLHWEHTLAVAVVLGTFVLLARPNPGWRRLVGAGVLIGVGPALRTELYCVPFAVAAFACVAWGVNRRTLARLVLMGAGALAVASCFWLWNWLAVGTWDPVVTVNRRVNQRRDRWPSLELLFADGRHDRWGRPWQICALAMLAGLLPSHRKPLLWARFIMGLTVVT
jgi:hypothetical protein